MTNNHNAIDGANQWRIWCSLHRTNYPSAAAYIARLTNELPEARCAIGYLNLHRRPENFDYDTFVAHCDLMTTKFNKPDLVFGNNLPDKYTPSPCGSKQRRV
ncbi:hypothetical protein N7517_000980 [Penicillium concentricum]|uniref:Uncharacterized protein n=1 Tax=Penicillium concentricum TaxID=293559 RepID=A0A9W9SSM5_9EURO|nr:uncharacterized protein N7517_000980 [Penicillium concentricum]KAJ5383069.1 hypothetical protein N7517_000980 [Penicillium concentricum]